VVRPLRAGRRVRAGVHPDQRGRRRTHINFAFCPLDDPGIVSNPPAFLPGWLGSVTGRPLSGPARFAQIQIRALTGVGAERGGHS